MKDLNAGLVTFVLLAVLAANEGEALFKEGTVYPVLRALSAAGLLTSRIVPSY